MPAVTLPALILGSHGRPISLRVLLSNSFQYFSLLLLVICLDRNHLYALQFIDRLQRFRIVTSDELVKSFSRSPLRTVRAEDPLDIKFCLFDANAFGDFSSERRAAPQMPTEVDLKIVDLFTILLPFHTDQSDVRDLILRARIDAAGHADADLVAEIRNRLFQIEDDLFCALLGLNHG